MIYVEHHDGPEEERRPGLARRVERLRKDAGVPVEHVVAELPSAAPLEGLRQ